MNKLFGSALVSVCLAAFATSAAVAQTTPNVESRSASAPGKAWPQRAFTRPTERVEARLAYLKTALKINDAQQAQWDAYTAVVRKNAQDREQWIKSRRSGEKGSPRHQRPNAIERLERAQSLHAELVSRINQLLAVQKPLYAALSPEQQKVADVVMNRRMRPMQWPSMHERGGFGRG
jgi:hypothetical protein